MVTEPRQQPAPSGSPTAANIDPRHHLKPQMKVIGTQGKVLGKVDAVELDPVSGSLVAITVRHGMLRKQLSRVPAARVKHVNDNSVVLDFSQKAFKLLPEANRS